MTEAGSVERPSEVVAAALESDSELQAIHSVLAALLPLKREGRTRVLDYVLRRLDPGAPTGAGGSSAYPTAPTASGASVERVGRQMDIRTLKNEKAPHSANEMAALVAYYL